MGQEELEGAVWDEIGRDLRDEISLDEKRRCKIALGETN